MTAVRMYDNLMKRVRVQPASRAAKRAGPRRKIKPSAAEPVVEAVQFDVTPTRFLLARTLGRFCAAFVHGRGSGLRRVDRPVPPLPGPAWMRIEVVLCGICGSDLAALAYRSSTALEPFGSFPAVLGHEILGRVVETGPEVTHVEAGQRVVVDPMLHCAVRGRPESAWCRSCVAGRHSTCEMAAEEASLEVGGEPLRRGLAIGYHASLPGGWSEQVVAHSQQVFAVPDALDDRVAVLTEPLSIGMHGVLESGAADVRGPVLVIGSGTIGLATVWALRTLGYEGRLVAQAKRRHEAGVAMALGASEVVQPGPAARQALVDTGARAYMPIVGPEVHAGGGFEQVFDCVGSESSIAQALGFASPRGKIVLLGCAGRLKKLDLAFLWAREVRVLGSVGYGMEEWRGGRMHTFEIALEAMEANSSGLKDVVTHVFPLRQYRDALRAAFHHRRSGAVKVALAPASAGRTVQDGRMDAGVQS